VVRYEKKEGGFNRVFVLFLDNGARVIARIPYHIAGPRRLATNSEVATMAYSMVKSATQINPVNLHTFQYDHLQKYPSQKFSIGAMKTILSVLNTSSWNTPLEFSYMKNGLL